MKSWIFLFFAGVHVQAQDYPRGDFDPASLVDEIFASQDLDLNYQDLYENFLQLISHPLDLNTVTDEQLRALYILKSDEVNSIVNYRTETGPFISVYELQTILDRAAFLKLIPFVTVPDVTQSFNRSILNRIATEPNNYLLLRWGRTLEPQRGYSSNASSGRYAGSPDSFYARFRVNRAGDFSLGFAVKKDAGEAIRWNPSKNQYGFDYLSFHLQTLNKKRIKNLILGDYQAQFGQGITLGSVFGIGKNGEAVSTMRRANLGFIPYTSIYEAGYFRGAAVSFLLGKYFVLHSMISVRGRDGALQQDTLSAGAEYLSSFSYTGLHRTVAELANRNAIGESNMGSVIQLKNKSLDAGLILHHTHFSIPLRRMPSLYNQFAFNGDENTNAGAYLNYNFSNHSLFSEFSQSLGYGWSLVAGMLTSLTSKLDVSLIYRQFDRNFFSFYGNAVAESSSVQNERGMYWGWKYSFNKKYSFAGYFDLFSFPWLKYHNYSPSDGHEWLARFNCRPSKTVFIFSQMREESRLRNSGTDNNLY
ncbi:MAG TPA: helix-hairpin-helix domain-containing protein, partial [Cyclobacteriaceae bacterium]|nr:helix-hairpin-helix domain-containing protein [Cyclobacteriaceae bacterium]